MSRLSKSVMFVIVIISAAFAFNSFQLPRVSAQTDNKALAQAWIAAINASFKTGDTTALAALYAPDFTDESMTQGMSVADYVKQSVGAIVVAFPDGKADIKDMVAEGDKVVVYSTLTGTNTGSLFGLKTGKAVSGVKLMDILTFKAGKIAKDDSVADTLTLLSQIGFTITPPTAPAATQAAQ